MISEAPHRTDAPVSQPTLWGLRPVQLHDRFWAARGIQVVRQGEPSQIVPDAELFLLTSARTLAIFRIGRLVDQISWLDPELLFVRLHQTRERGYREMVVTDEQGRFVRFDRQYSASDLRIARVALTPSRRLAEAWQNAPDPLSEWRRLRRSIPRTRRMTVSLDGNVYDRTSHHELMQCVHDVIRIWRTPDATIGRARRVTAGVWADAETPLDRSVRFIGPAWVGAGREDIAGQSVVGPAVLWDDPDRRPGTDDLEWQEIEPRPVFDRVVQVRPASSVFRTTKRIFDVVFSLAVLLVTAPLWPLIMLAIWLEDGRPFFFAHRRETLQGREFSCIKFRSMRKDADQIKADLAQHNQADGPQFFIDPDHDPRLTRVGHFLRETNLDELPQFLNVLAGDMAVVGPRPSPRTENQCCPPWREARLSVRPGITGLWQVMRTRQSGLDFQEWIKYDIEYVENAGWRMDLWIIWRTIAVILRLHPKD